MTKIITSRRRNWPVAQIEDAFSDAMERFFDPRGWLPTGEWAPALDIRETDDSIVVRAEVPGMSSGDIEVSVQNNTLTISGEKTEKTEDAGETYYRSERRYGAFRRDIPLATIVDTDRIQATCKDGVLTVTLPKSEQAKGKRIDVKAT